MSRHMDTRTSLISQTPNSTTHTYVSTHVMIVVDPSHRQCFWDQPSSSHNHPPRSHAESPVHTKVAKAKARGNNTGVRAASTGDTKISDITMPHHTSTNHHRTAFPPVQWHQQAQPSNPQWTPPPSAQDHQNPKGKQKGKGGKKGKSKQQW